MHEDRIVGFVHLFCVDDPVVPHISSKSHLRFDGSVKLLTAPTLRIHNIDVIERYGAPASQVRDADVVVAKSDWTLQSSSHATTRGRALQGVDTMSLGVMYTRGTCEVGRPDEPLANKISAKDAELQSITDDGLRQDHPYVRRFPLPDGSDLVLYSKRALNAS